MEFRGTPFEAIQSEWLTAYHDEVMPHVNTVLLDHIIMSSCKLEMLRPYTYALLCAPFISGYQKPKLIVNYGRPPGAW